MTLPRIWFFPLIPVFLTSVLGAPLAAVGAIEGTANAAANILKIASGRLSDAFRRRKVFAVVGYSLSAIFGRRSVTLTLSAMARHLPWRELLYLFSNGYGREELRSKY